MLADGGEPMIPAAIFILLFLTALSGLRDYRGLTLWLYFLSWFAIALLFAHHATESLPINL